MSNQRPAKRAASRTRQTTPVKAVPPPADGSAPPADGAAPAAPEAQDVRSIKPASVIAALQGSLNEKAQQLRGLEDRIVMLSAVIAEQDEEIAALKKRRR